MGKRHQKRRPGRRTPFLNPKRLFLIICEGKVTEPEYLEGFRKACRNPRVRIEIHKGKGTPKTIVAFAKNRKVAAERSARKKNDENEKFDEVWCVFDVDQHPHIPDARQMARDNEIELAISNPCFEIWLWLHFADQPGTRDRGELPGMIKQHIPGYDKHVRYPDYASGYEAAVRRAKRLDRDAEREQDVNRNPRTGVWRLTESIRSES